MARNPSEFYSGKRKKSGPAFLVSLVILSVIAFAILLFYGLQKYLVISNSGLYLDIPLISETGQSTSDDDGIITRDFEPVNAELIIGEPDYGNIKASAGEGLGAIKAVFVPFESCTEDNLPAYVDRAGSNGALLLDLKTVSGQLAWSSQTETALGYGTSGTLELAPLISSLHERGITVAVRLCCFVDDLLASRYGDVCLHKADGTAFSDDSGKWLDPTSTVVKQYIISLCRELTSMGVDEIVLNAMRMPETQESFAFAGKTSAASTPETAISGFAISLARSLKQTGANVSVQVNTDAAMQGVDTVTGQNADLFLKIFPRVYRLADKDTAAAGVGTVSGMIALGEAKYRFVPMCYDGAPDTSCYVLMS